MQTRSLLVALALLAACAGSSSAGSPKAETGTDAGFVSSWMNLDGEEAAQLVARGAAAAATRRDLLASAASANGFGEQALPGAYPPAGPEVAFTALLGGATLANFNTVKQKVYLGLVLLQAKYAGGKDPKVSILSSVPVAGGLSVRTRVVLPGPGQSQTSPAQRLVARLANNPGPGAPWLDALWPGSSVGEVTSPVRCTDPLCRACPASRQACTECVPSVGTPGRNDDFTVYLASSGRCQRCTAPNCDSCTARGACRACKAGYVADARGRCNPVCKDRLCLACPQGGRTCTQCAATSGIFSIYLNARKECKQCTRAYCAACSSDGKCGACKSGYASDGKGGCRRPCSSSLCTACPSRPNLCTACTEGHQAMGGQCQLACNVEDCVECYAGGKWCKKCVDGYKPSFNRMVCEEVCDVEGCTRCVPNTRGRVCAECRRPSTLSNGTCQRCSASNCETCQRGDDKKCLVCARPYRLSNGQCRKA